MTINYAHLFRLAHATAKAHRAEFCDYRDAFRWALTQAWIQVRATSNDLAGWTRGQAFAKYNELKAAYRAARAAYKADKTQQNADAADAAYNAISAFDSKLRNTRAPRGGFVQFRTSLAGDLYDSDDVLVAA